MSVLAPPPQDELELLIREARARQRRRGLLGAAVTVAVLAGVALGIESIVAGGNSGTSNAGSPGTGVRTGNACGIRMQGVRILGPSGQTVYREPGNWARPRRVPSEVQCSGSTVWVVWIDGVGMSQQAYVGARSGDGGQTWHLVFAESYFGVKAPHWLGSYLGPWTLRGTRDAYFAGSCPACALSGTVSLWVTKDGGRTFHRYDVPALEGFEPTRIRVSGRAVTISAKRFSRGVAPHKTATISVD